MYFTREPLIETIITPKEGYKLILRNTTPGEQEEFLVDMLEVISFGNNCFYRSLDKPKSFIVPAANYELVEVREARMVLKTSGVEKVKIAGGKVKEEDDEPKAKKSAHASVKRRQKPSKLQRLKRSLKS